MKTKNQEYRHCWKDVVYVSLTAKPTCILYSKWGKTILFYVLVSCFTSITCAASITSSNTSNVNIPDTSSYVSSAISISTAPAGSPLIPTSELQRSIILGEFESTTAQLLRPGSVLQ